MQGGGVESRVDSYCASRPDEDLPALPGREFERRIGVTGCRCLSAIFEETTSKFGNALVEVGDFYAGNATVGSVRFGGARDQRCEKVLNIPLA